MSTYESMIARQIKNIDPSLFKAEDLELLRPVLDLARDYGLSVMLMGSAADNARAGMPRQYNDIDLLIEDNPNDPEHRKKLNAFARRLPGWSGAFASNIESAQRLAEQYGSTVPEMIHYAETVLQGRFPVDGYSLDGKRLSTIDVCLEGVPVQQTISSPITDPLLAMIYEIEPDSTKVAVQRRSDGENFKYHEGFGPLGTKYPNTLTPRAIEQLHNFYELTLSPELQATLDDFDVNALTAEGPVYEAGPLIDTKFVGEEFTTIEADPVSLRSLSQLSQYFGAEKVDMQAQLASLDVDNLPSDIQEAAERLGLDRESLVGLCKQE